MTMHDEQALAAPYVLGALEADERRAFETHAATCTICQSEVASYRRVTEALAHAAPQRTPRPELRDKVLGAIGAPLPVQTWRPAAAARTRLAAWVPLAAAAVLLLAVSLYAVNLQGRLDALESRLRLAEARASAAERDTMQARRVADDAQTAMGVLAAPDLARIDLKGQPAAAQATARALWSRNRGMVFTAANLPPAPPGRVYQVWVVTAEAPVSAGVLAPDREGRASAVFNTPPDIAAPTAIAVTLEPAPGVTAPTGERYLIGLPGAL